MTLFQIITPVHRNDGRIQGAYQSLCAQSFTDWTWYILENGNANLRVSEPEIARDPRVILFRDDAQFPLDSPKPPNIGALKLTLCLASAMRHGQAPEEPYIVELDYDDQLASGALAAVAAAFEQHKADFVYSDFAEYKIDRKSNVLNTWDSYPYGEAFGWRHYETVGQRIGDVFRDSALLAMHAPPVTPHNLRLVDWSPNHLRAWRREAYLRAGGHDATLAVGDDHELIVRMFLRGAVFCHIPQCLYYYAVHEGNTVLNRNVEIRNATWGVYNRYIWQLAEKFAADNNLRKIDLCGAINPPPGYDVLDQNTIATPSIATIRVRDLDAAPVSVCDLNQHWPLEDNSVGVLRAHDAVEHLRDPIHTMNEAFRVLAPGGFFMISVPSTDGRGAFCDPTHVSFWNQLSFRYYTDARFAAYIPEFQGRFQLIKCITWFPDDWHRENNVPYVEAHLVKLGDGYTPMGEVLI